MPVAPEPAAVDVAAPLTGLCTAVHVSVGDVVAAGGALVTLESMKTEHPVTAPDDLSVESVVVQVGDDVTEGDVLLRVRRLPEGSVLHGPSGPSGTDRVPIGTERPDLRRVLDRRALLTDRLRPQAVARRLARGRRTARTNVEALVDPGSFNEYGGLAIASQRSRRDVDDLIARTPADGLIVGTATVGADVIGADRARVAVLAYDDIGPGRHPGVPEPPEDRSHPGVGGPARAADRAVRRGRGRPPRRRRCARGVRAWTSRPSPASPG